MRLTEDGDWVKYKDARALERDNALLREAASPEGMAVIKAAMRWYRQGRSEMLAQDDMALDRACAPLAAKRKEQK